MNFERLVVVGGIMYTETDLREKLKNLCETAPYIHISVSLTKPRVEISDECVKLVGVYKHIFQTEQEKNGRKQRYSIQYGDVIAGIVKIEELG